MLLHNLCALLELSILCSCLCHIPAVDPSRRLVNVASSLCPSLHRVHIVEKNRIVAAEKQNHARKNDNTPHTESGKLRDTQRESEISIQVIDDTSTENFKLNQCFTLHRKK